MPIPEGVFCADGIPTKSGGKMKASKLIETLQVLINKYGDAEVWLMPDDDAYMLGHIWFDFDDKEYILE